MNPKLKKWMRLATAGEQAELASIAGTSRGHLYQLSSGERRAGPELARRIENASKRMRKLNRDLPVLRRTELCPACGECEIVKRCRG